MCCRNVCGISEKQSVVCVIERHGKKISNMLCIIGDLHVISAYLLIIEASKINIYVAENKQVETKTFSVT